MGKDTKKNRNNHEMSVGNKAKASEYVNDTLCKTRFISLITITADPPARLRQSLSARGKSGESERFTKLKINETRA